MIDPQTVQRIKDTADIVDVVSDYVHLVRRGANYMGLCPFHNERTPSFSVNKGKNFCFCFSCKKGGSPVNFIMEKEGLTYHEALLHLAKKYGIKVEERELTDEERRKQSERESMLIANEWAMHQMEKDMHDTDEGRDVGLQYLTSRGVTDEAMKAFHLGYAIDNGQHLVTAAKKAGYSIDILKTLGLVGTSQQGRDYDRFRGRVIFPIINTSGKVIAFGGRDLKGGLAKYINSPESSLYKKSNELYGIFQARSAIVKENKCFLVEGYMDVIGMWQSGMKNVVASSGTALTDGQIALLHRFTENITLIYDGDAAGVKASLRGIDMLLSHKLNVKVLRLPPEHDPDSFARSHTPEQFKEYVEANETDIIRYKALVLLDTIKNDPQKRIAAINSVIESIAHIPDPVSRDVYTQECSTILGLAVETVAKSVAVKRAQLVEKWKRERQYNSIRQEGDSSVVPTPPQTPAQQAQTVPNDVNPAATTTAIQPKVVVKPTVTSLPMLPLEKPIVKYCLRYGYLPLCIGVDEQNKEIFMPVVEYIDEELTADSMVFSFETYRRIFKLVREMKPDFERAYQAKQEELEQELQKMREDRRAEIASQDYSVADIEREERLLDRDVVERRNRELREFVIDFPGRVLLSHEDDDIRNVTSALMLEPHRLSNIYVRNNADEREEDHLDMLIPRKLIEWRGEILNQKYKEILDRLGAIQGQGNVEEEQKLQLELISVMKKRSIMARESGERVVSSRKMRCNPPSSVNK